MKKLIFGYAMAMCGFMSVASADYCCPVQYDPCCSVADFNGLYVGGNVGVLTHTAFFNDTSALLPDNAGFVANRTHVEAGLQLGYDWQCCNSLFGLVVDWNWTHTRPRKHLVGPTGTELGFVESRAHWFTTIRARAGLTLCDTLVYVTGGAAVARFRNHWNNVTNDFRFHHTRWGWTGGFGAEFLLGCGWSVGAEVLWLHFDEHRRRASLIGGDFDLGHSNSFWVGRLELNYRFGDLCGCF